MKGAGMSCVSGLCRGSHIGPVRLRKRKDDGEAIKDQAPNACMEPGATYSSCDAGVPRSTPCEG